MTAASATNSAELATAVFLVSAERGDLSARVVPITCAEYQTRAKRPAHSQFDCAKVARVHRVSLPHWQSSLGPCVGRILEQGA
jgi:dTDP-4-dehydrorhamnose reductase